MSKNRQILYINPSDLSLISYDRKSFGKLKKRENLYTLSRVFYEDVIVYSFKIPSVQISDDLSSLVEIKMYEDAGLNINKRYKITYLLKKLDFDDLYLVEAFAIDMDFLKTKYNELLRKVKYIDFLALPFLSYTTFYTNKILEPQNDVFVYIGDNEAFLSFYKNGSYISTQSIIDLDKMVEKLRTKDIHVDLVRLKKILIDKGLVQEQYHESDIKLYFALETIFSDIFTKINNIAMHNRSVFSFSKIDRIFISTNDGRIKGLREFALNFGLNEVKIFDFNIFEEKQEDSYLDKIVCSYGLDKYIAKSNEHNINFFEKSPSFFSTKIGKLILLIFAFIAVLFVIYNYIYRDIQNLQKQKDSLSAKYQSIQNSSKKYKIDTRKILKKIKSTKQNINKESVVLKNIEQGVAKLEKMRRVDVRYVNFLVKVNSFLEKYGLKAKSIEQTGNRKMVIEVFSTYRNRDKIAKFLKLLIKKGFTNIMAEEIKLDKNIYISKVTIINE